MLPHERSLVTKMEGRPLALLGVNCDEQLETVQQASFRGAVTWRNWWNGGSNEEFTSRYGVRSFPMTYVLDANGVVRYRKLRGAELEQAVEALVRELESAKR